MAKKTKDSKKNQTPKTESKAHPSAQKIPATTNTQPPNPVTSVQQSSHNTPNSKNATTLKTEIVQDFPRGGSTGLTPLEYREVSHEAKIDFYNEESAKSKKRKPSTIKSDSKKQKLEFSSSQPQDKDEILYNSISPLTIKKVIKGDKFLGVITKIGDLELTVSLPNSLTAQIPITNISKELSAILENIADDNPEDSPSNEDDLDQNKTDSLDLRQRFFPGQFLKCTVTAVKSPDTTNSTTKKTVQRDSLIELSIEPEETNKDLNPSDISKGMLIAASITSVEDHGYILNTGIDGIQGFLAYSESQEFADKHFRAPSSTDGESVETKLKVGQVVLACISSEVSNSNKNGGHQIRSLTLSLSGKDIEKSKIKETLSSIHSVQPGSMVSALITHIGEKGAALSFMGFYNCTATIGSLGSNYSQATDEILSKIKLGDKIKVRIIYVSLATSSKTILVSCASHIMSLSYPSIQTESIDQISNSIGYWWPAKYGTKLDVTVKRVNQRHGLYMEGSLDTGTNVSCFAHLTNIFDSVDQAPLTDTSGEYKLQSSQHARVIGYSAMDNILLVSLKKSVYEEELFHIYDLFPAQKVEGKVEKITDSGIIIRLSPYITGYVSADHLADAKISKPEKKFRVGGSVKGRILNINYGNRKVYITLRKSFLDSSLPPVKDFSNENIGKVSNGVVSKIIPGSGAIVAFYQNLRGFIPTKEISDGLVSNINDFLRIGQPIKVKILSVDANQSRILCSLRKSTETGPSSAVSFNSDNSQISVGTVYTDSIVDNITDTIVYLRLKPSNNLALLNINHLSDHLGNTVERIKQSLKKDQPLGMPIVVVENKSTTISVSAKPSLVNAANKGLMIKSLDDCKLGLISVGYVSHLTKFGVFVKFFGGFTGMASINSIADQYVSSVESQFEINQTVLAKIILVNEEAKQVNLSLKPSQVETDIFEDNNTKSVALEYGKLFVSQLFSSEQTLIESQNNTQLIDLANSYNSLLGELMKIKVEEIHPYGWVVKPVLDKSNAMISDASGFISSEHTGDYTIDNSGEKNIKVGDILTAKVIDVDFRKKIIDYSLKQIYLDNSNDKQKKTKSKGKGKKTDNISPETKFKELEKSGSSIDFIVDLIKEDHLVLVSPSCGNSIVYTCSKTLNYRSKPFMRYKIGQKLRGIIISTQTNKRVLCLITDRDKEPVFSGVKRVAENPIDPTKSYFEDYQPGTKTKAKVISINKSKMSAKLALADNIQGRLTFMELLGSYGGKEDLFTGNKIAENSLISVTIVGAHTPTSRKYLPITQRINPAKVVLETTIEKNYTNTQRSLQIGDINKDTELTGVVSQVISSRDGGIWVSINNNLKAKVSIMSISNNYEILQNMEKYFVIGSPVEIKITHVKAKLYAIDAVMTEKTLSDRKIPPPVKTINEIAVGDKLAGFFIKYSEFTGLNVLINGFENNEFKPIHGRVGLVDISDDYSKIHEITKTTLKPNCVLNLYVLQVDKERNRLDLTTRESVVGGSESVVVDRRITNVSELKIGDRINGFISSVSKKGIFVVIGSCGLSGRVKLSEISEDFVKNPEEKYKPGMMINVQVLSVNEAENQAELTMRSTKESKKLEIGDLVEGNVTKTNKSGIFIRIYDTFKQKKIVVLCPTTEIADNSDTPVTELLSHYESGDKVIAKIINVDEKNRITLSLKSSHFLEQDNKDEMDVDSEGEESDSNSDEELDEQVDEDIELEESENELDEKDVGEIDDESADEVTDEIDEESDQEDEEMEDGSEEDDDSDSEEELESTDKKTLEIGNNGFSWNGVDTTINSDTIQNQSDITGDLLDKKPTSVEDYERLLVGSPNSSFLWVSYMAFYCGLGEIDMARQVCDRGLEKITFRLEQEKMNLYIARLNLEYKFGTRSSLDAVFEKALTYMNQKHIYLQLARIYSSDNNVEMGLETLQQASKKFKTSSKVWVQYFEFVLQHNLESKELMQKSLVGLPKRKHVKTITKFAQLEFKYNHQETARTIFENLLSNYPNRTDLWNVYLDLETKNISKNELSSETDLFLARNLFSRVTSLKFNAKNMKLFFKKWLQFEKNHGTNSHIENVKSRALEYVQSLSFGPKYKQFKLLEKHRNNVLCIYRKLLKSSEKIEDDISKTFLKSWIKERFRFNKELNTKKKLQECIYEALKSLKTIDRAIEFGGKDLQLINDFAYGKKGRVEYILNRVKAGKPEEYNRLLHDIRSKSSIKKNPQQWYAIPFDTRLFAVPKHILEITKESALKEKTKNKRIIPPDEVVYQDVVTSSGLKFYRIKGRIQPHWISTKIKHLTLTLDKTNKRINLLENYKLDMKEEQSFLSRLGIHDSGYKEPMDDGLNELRDKINRIKNYK
ncbi:hypothetical protein BB559_000901 [Furculomyces boomerangus]|uniref:S1 motif domain-containing protein n=1 Tax=Furculomyces boomerangus TaxID=61424 RepID=A0A2T9Z3R7_9FUNG|nr:hypothetical protein BB559_000901 [Furculomyces boomerangus]